MPPLSSNRLIVCLALESYTYDASCPPQFYAKGIDIEVITQTEYSASGADPEAKKRAGMRQFGTGGDPRLVRDQHQPLCICCNHQTHSLAGARADAQRVLHAA